MRGTCIAMALASLVTGTLHAAEPKPAPPAQSKVEPVDVEFLEFLGSLDTEEEEWREYLESRPIRVEGKAAQKAPPAKPDPKKKEQVKKP